ncbi:SH3 domain-containing protein [Pseudomonas sp. PS01303]|jgi:hypothetical protein|uniref:SH3 domain-containing protein n=1 Tax=Pseudomonas sp. PS01303 TaxID=2991439 RepID=UPI00249C90B4|nr:SH3 domain-containing protein [Pseudomonas sp. PS01303]
MSTNDWSDVEIQATVEAYFRMLLREQSGQTVNKAHENRVLREGVLNSRTKASVEFRMQNISAVFEELGLQRISGYKPAKNIGLAVSNRIRKATASLNNIEVLALAPEWFEEQKNSLLYNYLTSHSPEAHRTTKHFTFDSAHFDTSTETLYTPPSNKLDLEKEIVEVIENGASLTELSVDAYRYLSVFLTFFWDKLQKFLNVIALAALITTSYSATEASKTPEEIRATVKSLTSEQRALLKGYSVVTADEVILRATPNKNSDELARLPKGEWVENIHGDTSSWIKVKADVDGEDVEGWIYRSYLVKLQ